MTDQVHRESQDYRQQTDSAKILEGEAKDFERNPMRHEWTSLFDCHPALNPPPFHHGVLTTQFRSIKSKLIPAKSKASENQHFVYMVTSSLPKEGTTSVAINLATSLSLEKDSQTVIIDCCGFQSSLTAQLKGNSLLGLMDYLEGSADIERVIFPLPTPKLHMIPHGTLNPCRAELYASQKMSELIENTQKIFPQNFIIIDAPPVRDLSEAQILSQYCDGIIFVGHKTKTPQSVFMKCINSLPKDKVLGVIVNHASFLNQSAHSS